MVVCRRYLLSNMAILGIYVNLQPGSYLSFKIAPELDKLRPQLLSADFTINSMDSFVWLGEFQTYLRYSLHFNGFYNHQTFQVPKMEVLSLIRLLWGWVSPYISLTYCLHRWVPPFWVPEMFGDITIIMEKTNLSYLIMKVTTSSSHLNPPRKQHTFTSLPPYSRGTLHEKTSLPSFRASHFRTPRKKGPIIPQHPSRMPEDAKQTKLQSWI